MFTRHSLWASLLVGSAVLVGVPDSARACFRGGAATVRAGFVGPVGVGGFNATRVRTVGFSPFGPNVVTVRQGNVVGPLGRTASYSAVRDRFVVGPFGPVVGSTGVVRSGVVGVPGGVYGARGVVVGAGYPPGVGGGFVTTLPAGYQRVVIRGIPYYRAGGVYYQRVRVRGRWGFAAVTPP